MGAYPQGRPRQEESDRAGEAAVSTEPAALPQRVLGALSSGEEAAGRGQQGGKDE